MTSRSPFPPPGKDDGPYSITSLGLVESVAGTLAEATLTLPVDPRLLVGVLLYKVFMFVDVPRPANPIADQVAEVLSQGALSTIQGLAALPNPADAGLIAYTSDTKLISSQIGDSGVGIGGTVVGTWWDFTPGGLLVVDRTLSLYVQSLLSLDVVRAFCKLYYRLVSIQAEDVLAAVSLVADVS